MLKQSGVAWRTLKQIEAFNDSLNDSQKAKLSEIKTAVRGMSAGVVPEDIRPIVDYVLADDGESTVVKAIGAVMHPTVKSSLAGLLPFSKGKDEQPVLEPVTIKCRECGFIAQYGNEEHTHN